MPMDIATNMVYKEFIELMTEFSDYWCYEIEKIAKEIHITPNEFICLRIFFHSDTSSVKEILHKTGISNSRLSRILDRLEKRGLITRGIDPKDHRLMYITLTGKGKLFIQDLQDYLEQIFMPSVENIPPEYIDFMITGLNRILLYKSKKNINSNSMMA